MTASPLPLYTTLSCAAHNRGAVVFHRALRNPQIGGDVLAGMTGEHQIHDLALTIGQACNMT